MIIETREVVFKKNKKTCGVKLIRHKVDIVPQTTLAIDKKL